MPHLCLTNRAVWGGQQQREPAVSALQPLLWAVGGRGQWSSDSHTVLQGLVGIGVGLVSLATWACSTFKPVPGPTQATGRGEVEDAQGARPALDLKLPTPSSPPCPPGQPSTSSQLPLGPQCSLWWARLLLQLHRWPRGRRTHSLSCGLRGSGLWVGAGHRQTVVSG